MRKQNDIRDYPALTISTERRVRFEEVDQLSYMWHGRYPSWFEDGREAMGSRYNINYLDFYAQGVVVPIKTLSIDYKKPLLYNNIYTIETSLLWNDSAILEYHYTFFDSEGATCTTGITKQLMLDTKGNLLFDVPQFYKEFCQRWTQGLV